MLIRSITAAALGASFVLAGCASSDPAATGTTTVSTRGECVVTTGSNLCRDKGRAPVGNVTTVDPAKMDRSAITQGSAGAKGKTD